MTVLLLNPPGSRRYNRDYYCGEQSKGPYVFPPTDLLVLSGLLRGRHEVEVLDAMVEGLGVQQALERIRAVAPSAIASLASSVSWSEDSEFFRALRRVTPAPILLTGDLPRAAPETVLAWNEAVDGVILDFTDCDLADFVDGRRAGLVHIHTRKAAALTRPRNMAYLVPQHERFPLRRYHHPLLSRHPYTTVITDYSCPFSCTFCPYERIPYKTRDLGLVQAELEHIHRLGVRALLINDASFGASRSRALDVCRILRGFPDRFRWICDMRVDHADPDLLAQMKEAGCEVVQFGVETATQPVLDSVRKGITPDDARRAFRAAREVGLRTLAHFILGLEGETRETQERLIDLALELNPDYASFGLASPLWGTSMRDALVERGVIDASATGFDVSGERPSWDSQYLSRHAIEEVRQAAYRRFYFRPSYVLRRLLSVRSIYEARNLVFQGLHMAGWPWVSR